MEVPIGVRVVHPEKGGQDEKWHVVFRGGELVALKLGEKYWFEVGEENGRALFFRQLEDPGKKERVEFRAGNSPTGFTGDIRVNTLRLL